MNVGENFLEPSTTPSGAGRRRMLSAKGEPLFLADWVDALFIHYEVDPIALQRYVPFELHLWEGRAFVSLVAFTMRRMRPRFGGCLAAWLVRPIATHPFLNLRAYVQHRREPGIYFLAEWLPNRLAVHLGPAIFGLPYRLGQIEYGDAHGGKIRGSVTAADHAGALRWRAVPRRGADPGPCEVDSLDEFLLERYTAFTQVGMRRCFFRIWHCPWPQVPAEVAMENETLLTATGEWARTARCTGGNYSRGVRNVWMGRPQRLKPNVK